MGAAVAVDAPDPRDELLLRADVRSGVRGRTVSGLRWTLGTQGATLLLTLAATFVLARLLTPDDYGLYGMVIAITLFAEQSLGLGLGQAVIQRPLITHRQASNLFWVVVGIGLTLAGLAVLAAPAIAAFYGRDEVTGLVRLLAVGFVLQSLLVLHHAVLLRQLRFRAVALRTLISRGVGAAAAVALGVAGAGYWSLASQHLVAGIVSVAAVWVSLPWRPGWYRRGIPMRELFSMGGGFSVFQILNYLSRNVDNILIGRVLGATQLGFYTRAYTLLMLPIQQLQQPVSQVAQATLSALWPEPERYRRYYVSAITGMGFVGMPAVVFLAVMAPEVIQIALGDGWQQAVAVFRFLAVAGLLTVIGYANGWLYSSSGQSWRAARWALVSRPVLIVSFVAGLPWGIVGVAAAYAAASLALLPFGFLNATRGTPVGLGDIAGAAWRPLLLAVSMGALCAGVRVATAGWGDIAVLATATAAAGTWVLLVVGCWPKARRDVLALLGRGQSR
jgi:PST family polysaccharide transporter